MNETPTLQVSQPTVILHGGGLAMVCDLNGGLQSDQLHGFFAGDTRVLSSYRLGVGGTTWQLLGFTRLGPATASWSFQNQKLRGAGQEVPAGELSLTLRRRLDGALHDDLTVRSFARQRLQVRLTLQLDADFADLFEVKSGALPPRIGIRRVSRADELTLAYERRGFRRGLKVMVRPSAGKAIFAGTQLVFDLDLAPQAEWRCCLEAAPVVDSQQLSPAADPHGPEPDPAAVGEGVSLEAPTLLQLPFNTGQTDLHALAMPQAAAPPYIAAGAPWFMTLFGRDTLVTALMAGLDGAWLAEGALAALAHLQATERDDWRDAEPGKLPHEMRVGELAFSKRIPHSPYYGAHDAPALYCLALWHTWRWSGERAALDAHLETALKALRWCDELGDRDGDGLQEYGTRSRNGYVNQSWKDAGDAIVHADGRQAELPLATVELQGYLFAARLAMAELLEAVGEHEEARRLHRAAQVLRDLVERRFWLENERYYAFALDGSKQLVEGIGSNPGHLLWAGLPSAARAALVARRMLRPDLASGWGLRTLSADNPAYNPLAYQRGSVWPHDTVLAAAGLWRYGRREEAGALMRAILEAAACFADGRLPELFGGFGRDHGLPVPYAEANSPQAWAAAVPLTIAQVLLGLLPDAPRGRCYLSPWLPEWLPRLAVSGIRIGTATLDVVALRQGDKTVLEYSSGRGLQVVEGTAAAPLWGEPWSGSQVGEAGATQRQRRS
ncbi:MAG: amylo-alpha-1,6-glucosidase [Chloroflexota bacterium]